MYLPFYKASGIVWGIRYLLIALLDSMLQNILLVIEVILAVLLIAVILIQHKGAGLGAGFGNTGVTVASTKRGVDLFLHRFTITLAILFFGIAIVAILL